jgi:hypothetical protein
MKTMHAKAPRMRTALVHERIVTRKSGTNPKQISSACSGVDGNIDRFELSVISPYCACDDAYVQNMWTVNRSAKGGVALPDWPGYF